MKAYMTCRAVQSAKIDFDATPDERNENRGEAKRRAEQFFRMRPVSAWTDGDRGPRRSATVAAFVAALPVLGCAPAALVPCRPHDAPTVTLPLALAGVRDEHFVEPLPATIC